MHQQLLDEPVLLDLPRILWRVELEILLPRSPPPSQSIVLVLVQVVRGELWVVDPRRPHGAAAVERLDGGGPRVGTERVRVARRRRTLARTRLAPWRRRRTTHEHLLRRLRGRERVVELEGSGRGRTREPRVGFGAPAAALLVCAESLPVYPTDVGVVDRAAEGGLERGRADRF